MRKFFIALSILVLIVLLSTGIQQKMERSNIDNPKIHEVNVMYRNDMA